MAQPARDEGDGWDTRRVIRNLDELVVSGRRFATIYADSQWMYHCDRTENESGSISLGSIYGDGGSLEVGLPWTHYSSQILFFGTELIRA
jgi:hypothetical protein